MPSSRVGSMPRVVFEQNFVATGQFGKNHCGDLNKYMLTAHGFDEFFGNLYHLNAEEGPADALYDQLSQDADDTYTIRARLLDSELRYVGPAD